MANEFSTQRVPVASVIKAIVALQARGDANLWSG